MKTYILILGFFWLFFGNISTVSCQETSSVKIVSIVKLAESDTKDNYKEKTNTHNDNIMKKLLKKHYVNKPNVSDNFKKNNNYLVDNINPIGTSFETATQLGCTEYYHTATLMYQYQSYYYEVHLDGDNYTWNLNSNPTYADIDLYLYNYNQQLVESSTGSSYPKTINFSGNGWYFLKVKSNSGYWSYDLIWDIEPFNFSNSYFILEGTDTKGVEGVINDNSDHYYYSDWSSGQLLELSLVGEYGTDFDVYIYNSNYELIASGISTSYPEVVNFTTSWPTYIDVYSYSGSGEYNFEIESGTPTPYFYNVYTINTVDEDNDGYYEEWDFEIDVDVPNGQTASTEIHITDDEGNDYGWFGPFSFTGSLTSDNQEIGTFTDDMVAPDNPPEDVVFTFTLSNGGDIETQTVPVDDPNPPINIDLDLTGGSYFPNPCFLDEDLTINAEITNNGTSTANNVLIEYYLSENNIISQTDHLVGSDYVTLSPGQSGWESITQNLSNVVPPLTPGNPYYVGIYMNAQGSYGGYWYWTTQLEVIEPPGGVNNNLTSQSITDYSLSAPHPNPFNPSTTLSYSLPSPSDVVLTIFEITGREIAQLVDDYKTAGTHNITWNAENFTSGIYFARLTAGDFTQTQKLLLIK